MKNKSNIVLLSVTIFFYLLFLQFQNSIFSIKNSNSTLVEESISIITSQQYNILFVIFFSFLVFVLQKISNSKRLLLFITSIFLLYFTLDQLFYSIFFTHYSFKFDEEAKNFSVQLLSDSFLSILDLSFFINLFIISFLIYFLAKHFKQKNETNWTEKISKKAKYTSVIFVVFLFVVGFFKQKSNNPQSENAFFVLINSFFQKSKDFNAQNADLSKEDIEKLYQLKFGKPYNSNQNLSSLIKQNNSENKKRNVIYIILESVGSLNFLKNEKLNKSISPNLYNFQDQVILFPKIYNQFPGTTRAHVSILTGGHDITHGSVSIELKNKFIGPTLVSEFKKEKYQTALFSAQYMDFENLDVFYKNLEFNKLFLANYQTKAYKKTHELNSWGIDENETWNQMKKWINNNKKSPFFVEFMNVGTHHPYSVPSSYDVPFGNKKAVDRYKNALHFIDNLIGEMVKFLKENGLYENTIICINGDHGEAFGDRHFKNYLHRNYLYQENIQNFFLILDPKKSGDIVISKNPASIADIMPSMLTYCNVPFSNKILGQDLFTEKYQSKIQYFYKNATPSLWGLLDGEWKYIEEIVDSNNPELYNLKTDPFEKNNLAKKYPKQVAYYSNLIPKWYLYANKQFRKNLKGFEYGKGDYVLNIDKIRSTGPKTMDFGTVDSKEEFHKFLTIHPNEKVFVYLRINPYKENKKVTFVWTSPSGKKIYNDFLINKDWDYAWKVFERKEVLEDGLWECALVENNKILIKNTLIISTKEKIRSPYLFKKGPLDILFGINKEQGFFELKQIHPNERLVAFSHIYPYDSDQELIYSWTSPSGKNFKSKLICKKGWDFVWIPLYSNKVMENGKWKIKIYEKNKIVLESYFEINSSATLHQKKLIGL